MTSSLGPAYRAETLDTMDGGHFDVIVVGGGITGVGCALDAASRGLSVALIEQRDIASGTSSRSSKLFHGGLRYLEQGNIKLVMEALHERELIRQELAPHLVWPVPFLYPLRHRVWERAYIGAGITLYEILARIGGNKLPRQWHLGRSDLTEVFPSMKRDTFIGGIRYYDAGTDDARYTVAVARTAGGLGARILTSARVTDFTRQDDRVNGVRATCLETGRTFSTTARVVVNATGVWTDRVEQLIGDDRVDVKASKGTHVVIPRERIDARVGFITKTPSSVLFLIPHDRFWHIGTTDTPWSLGLAHPAANKSDIDYVLAQANEIIDPPLTHDDIVGVYAGLRPLVAGNAASTAKLSREHSITHPAPGLVSIAGGKFTTYRVMGEDTIDRAFESIGMSIPPSTTNELALIGAAGYRALKNRTAEVARRYGMGEDDVRRLLHRYGDETTTVLDLAAADPTLARTIPSGDYLGAEVRFAVEHEGALHLDDVLTRRTRLSIECTDRGVKGSRFVADIMGKTLGWDSATVARELVHYEGRVGAELESQTKPDDRTDGFARRGAPDIRTVGDPGDATGA
ncbi:MAG: glycerol-3-phosphate dehydrogenase/oxidase, partial [Acidimicrobiia bacterium]|nr:glycerol-3-phosphate dehydrogenase/oxidase [Acidimicrobiia bacterium]